jgi:hypothetical protein
MDKDNKIKWKIKNNKIIKNNLKIIKRKKETERNTKFSAILIKNNLK